jgi:SAM-dependent methyltransferase
MDATSPDDLTAAAPVTEREIAEFWQHHPCGNDQVGGLRGDYERFFRAYDAFRYAREGHILDCLDAIDFRGRKVLEIGLGQGADSEQIIRRGAIWSGLDLTPEAVERTRTRLELRHLPYERVIQGSALDMPLPDGAFDIVFSHGVLHHIPDIHAAQREIRRVLKPGGELIVMLYARRSLNYLLSISVVRRLGLIALYPFAGRGHSIYDQHVRNAREMGLWRYLKMENFLHRNTDGPFNPYSKVYDPELIGRDFPDFVRVKSYQRFMYAPPLPVSRLPLERWLGWHLWAHLRPRS